VINVGNTSLFAGVFNAETLVAQFRVPMAGLKAGSPLSPGLFSRVRGRIDRAVICSVVPKLTDKVSQLVVRVFGVEPGRLVPEAPHGLKIAYREPGRLGADRIAAALGVQKLFPRKNVMVVDCGTATTITAIHAGGIVLGGAIFPGAALWPAMLQARTAQLPALKLRRPKVALGRSPEAGILSGNFHGHVGAIRELTRKIGAEAFGRGSVIVIGTGGHVRFFAEENIFDHVLPALVLVGLNEFAARMAAHGL
jgi:type III pantothenate kinase